MRGLRRDRLPIFLCRVQNRKFQVWPILVCVICAICGSLDRGLSNVSRKTVLDSSELVELAKVENKYVNVRIDSSRIKPRLLSYEPSLSVSGS